MFVSPPSTSGTRCSLCVTSGSHAFSLQITWHFCSNTALSFVSERENTPGFVLPFTLHMWKCPQIWSWDLSGGNEVSVLSCFISADVMATEWVIRVTIWYLRDKTAHIWPESRLGCSQLILPAQMILQFSSGLISYLGGWDLKLQNCWVLEVDLASFGYVKLFSSDLYGNLNRIYICIVAFFFFSFFKSFECLYK